MAGCQTIFYIYSFSCREPLLAWLLGTTSVFFFNKTGGCGTMFLRRYRFFLPPKVARALPSGRPKAARCLGTALSTALVLGCGLSLLHFGEDSSASSDLKLLDF